MLLLLIILWAIAATLLTLAMPLAGTVFLGLSVAVNLWGIRRARRQFYGPTTAEPGRGVVACVGDGCSGGDC